MSDNYPQIGKALVWVFRLVDATDGYTAETGLSPTVTISKDGGAFAALTGAPAVTEIANGWYKITVPAADMAATIILHATGTGARPASERFYVPGDWISRLVGKVVHNRATQVNSYKQPDGTTEQFSSSFTAVDTAYSQGRITGDPFRSGDTGADQLGLAYPITLGLHFPDMVGPVVLLRRKVYPGDIEDWYYAGTAHPGTGTIVNGNGITHSASSGYEYTAARVFGNGFMSQCAGPVRVDFDGAGDVITPALPTWPRDVRAEPIAGGTFAISWLYSSWSEGAPPTDFVIYEGSDGDSIDYGTAIGTLAFDPQLLQHRFETGIYTHGTTHAFAVRARNSNAVAELNEFTTETLKAEDAVPAAAMIISASVRGPSG